jgi:hypothetical protein
VPGMGTGWPSRVTRVRGHFRIGCPWTLTQWLNAGDFAGKCRARVVQPKVKRVDDASFSIPLHSSDARRFQKPAPWLAEPIYVNYLDRSAELYRHSDWHRRASHARDPERSWSSLANTATHYSHSHADLHVRPDCCRPAASDRTHAHERYVARMLRH